MVSVHTGKPDAADVRHSATCHDWSSPVLPLSAGLRLWMPRRALARLAAVAASLRALVSADEGRLAQLALR